jgi:hypothetical protein
MTYALRYEPQAQILFATLYLIPTLPESLGILAHITSAPDYPADVSILWDVRAIDARTFNANVFRQFIDARRRFPARGRARIAILVDSDFAYGMGRMYEMLSEVSDLPQAVRIFRHSTEAEQWLKQQVLARCS